LGWHIKIIVLPHARVVENKQQQQQQQQLLLFYATTTKIGLAR